MLERLRAFLGGGDIEVEAGGEEQIPAPRRRWPYLLAALFVLWLLVPEDPDFPEHPFKNPKHPQVKLAEEFNRRLENNPKAHNILVIDRAETTKRFPVLRDRVGRFAWEKMKLDISDNSTAHNLRRDIARNHGGFCSSRSFSSLWDAFLDRGPAYPAEYLFLALPDGPEVSATQTVVDIAAEYSPWVVVRPDLPFTDEQMQRLVLYHEAFGHGMDGEHAQDNGPGGQLLPGALTELRADIAAIVAMTKETRSTTLGRSWAGLRSLGALNRAVLNLNARKPRHIALDNTYNNGDALEKVLDSLDATLDDPGKADAFLRMDDDALHARIDAEMEKVRFTRAECARRGKVLEAAALISLDGETPAGEYKIGPRALRIRAKSPELLGPALRFLRQCDAARDYHFLKLRPFPRPAPPESPAFPLSGASPMSRLAATALLLGLLAAPALAETPEEHERLAREFQKRARATGHPIVVFDRLKTAQTAEYVRQQLKEALNIADGDAEEIANAIAPDIGRRAALQMTGECFRLPNPQNEMFRAILPNHPGVSDTAVFTQMLRCWGDPLAKPFPITGATFNRFLLAHETLGHGTECDSSLNPDGECEEYRRAAAELRADICAAAFMAREEGHTKTARTIASIRTLAAYNIVAQETVMGNLYAGREVSFYNHGRDLDFAANAIDAALPRLAKMDDVALLEFADNVFEQVRPSCKEWQETSENLHLTLMMRIFGNNIDAARGMRASAPHYLANRAFLMRLARAHRTLMEHSPVRR